MLAVLVATLLAPVCEKTPNFFKQIEGEWIVAWEYRIDGTLTRVESARSTIRRTTAGCALYEDLQGVVAGQEITVNVLSANAGTDSTTSAYVDSEHRQVLLFRGMIEGDTMTVTWSEKFGDRTMRVRRTYRGSGAIGFSVEVHMSRDIGSEWELVQRIRYTRKP